MHGEGSFLRHGSKRASLRLFIDLNTVVLSKQKLINNLFLLAFPFYGIGMYVSFKVSITVGLILAVSPFLLIILLHVFDLIYTRSVRNVVTRTYWFGLLFLISLSASMWKALGLGYPGANPGNTMAFCVLFLAPFHAAIIVQVRNRENEEFDFARMVLKGLSLLVLINVLGLAAGLQNLLHRIDGRVNMPFLLGIYDAAHLLSLVNLMLLFYMKDFVKRPGPFVVLLGFYFLNMVLMLGVNSRLSFMTFLILTTLFLFRMVGKSRLMFPLSLFTMTLLTNFALFVYWILTLPFMTAIVSRVNKEDVTTFNNRTTVWDVCWNWIETDRKNLLWGFGYQGQIYLKGWDHIGDVFNVRHAYNVHMHSTSMQTLVSQGLVGYVLLTIVMWFLFRHFRESYLKGALEAPLFAAVVYLLFILQIDIVCYGYDFGNALIFCLFSMAVIDPKYIKRRPRAFDGASPS